MQRARFVLYAADGMQDIDIAERLDCSVDCVAKWRRRFSEQRLEGLADKPGQAARGVFPPEQVAAVKAVACELPIRYGLPLSRFSLSYTGW